MKTFNFIEAGKYDWSILLGCFYTHKNGKRMKNWTLIHPDDDIELMKTKVADSLFNCAESGGSWSLDVTVEELNKIGCEDMHTIMFSPF